jgi:hypothetical protein
LSLNILRGDTPFGPLNKPPVEYKYDFSELQNQIKKSVDDALSQIQKQIKSNEYTLPNFNLTNYNFFDTTKFLTESLENVEKSFGYVVDTIVDVVHAVNGTKIGLPQIDISKDETLNKIESLADSVLNGMESLRENIESLKEKKN